MDVEIRKEGSTSLLYLILEDEPFLHRTVQIILREKQEEIYSEGIIGNQNLNQYVDKERDLRDSKRKREEENVLLWSLHRTIWRRPPS